MVCYTEVTIRILLCLDDPFPVNLFDICLSSDEPRPFCVHSPMSRETGGLVCDGMGHSQLCVSVSYGSLQSFGMACASASGNSLCTFIDQHSVNYSRGAHFRIWHSPCAAPLPSPFLWALTALLFLSPAISALLKETQALPRPHPRTLPWKPS